MLEKKSVPHSYFVSFPFMAKSNADFGLNLKTAAKKKAMSSSMLIAFLVLER